MNVWWIESQCIFKAAQRDCADVRLCAWNETVHLDFLTPSFSHLILTYFKTLAYFFYNTRVELKLPKKNVCKTFCNTFCTILGQQPCKPKGKKLMNILVSCLWTTSSDIASVSFWVTVALFVLCPFVKLFLNVYTWFSNCLFCTFNFIIKQCKLSPWCLEDHIV